MSRATMLTHVRIALLAVSGALGALARYGIGVAFGVRSFPWPTLAINVVGSFVLGVVLLVGEERWSRDWVVAISVGFLGAFTTFSTFSYEAQTLLRTGRPGVAFLYAMASVIAGVGAAGLGYAVGRAVLA